MPKTFSQARYWILTIPQHEFTPFLPASCSYIRGQLECGSTTSYLHWQLVVAFKTKLRLGGVKNVFGNGIHAEATKSDAAYDYVWKDDTAVVGTRFELGAKPMDRGKSADWEAVRDAAKAGRLDDIPADIYVRSYNALKRISQDHLQPSAMQREIYVYWGASGVGKSRRAWDEAGFDAYPKDPRSKFWDGYSGHRNVVIDEFRGGIDIAHILRWFDRYPVIIEVKGSSVVLKAEKIWITSNLHPRLWYPDLDTLTMDALLRRLKIYEIPLIKDGFD